MPSWKKRLLVFSTIHPRICAIAPIAVEPSIPALSVSFQLAQLIYPWQRAAVTAELSGFRVSALGCGRCWYPPLAEYRHVIDSASVLIVVAGMEEPCPNVVAGLAGVVIAVPTSIYGASFGGLAPLDNAQLLCPGVGW